MPNLLERPGDWAIGRAIGLGVYELIAARVRRLTSPNNRGSAFRASASARAVTTEMECVRTKIRGHLVELFQRRVHAFLRISSSSGWNLRLRTALLVRV